MDFSTTANMPNRHQPRRRRYPPKQTEPRPMPENCICLRPKALVVCKACGHHLISRKRIPCPAHPQTIFLMDLDLCPKCHNEDTWLREYPCGD
ncbi:uncharacterized protein CG13380-like [Macrosteles quadrilineatus]|uniref:uncharacterized protein CG13380-like n=1 Tax=Macrosteles quadrilineatus TaxID=74068 RepID=UPI0023E141FA|nr:uncharacterized protein CG13380-like [Macrosteles quadrilineatus]